MISLYRPGSSVLHRAPTGWKLLGLIVIIFFVTFFARGANWMGFVSLALAAAGTMLGYLIAGFGIRELARQVVALRWLILVMLVFQFIFVPGEEALLNTARIICVIVLAALFTLTTPTGDLLDLVERMCAPLGRLGINPARVGLVLALTITSVPVLANFAAQIREAQLARGSRGLPHLLVVPLLIMALKHADDLADALAARGAD